ncbi:MAG: hypothetical protein Q4C64_04105 [Erysipelotrichia bacterium]|nr:hypothetical protein [Erysipelotrichia bacterium]
MKIIKKALVRGFVYGLFGMPAFIFGMKIGFTVIDSINNRINKVEEDLEENEEEIIL